MRIIRILGLLVGLVGGLFAVTAAEAATTASSHTSFSVTSSVNLTNTTGDTAFGALDGTVANGTARSGTEPTIFNIDSNDPAGVQMNVAASAATYVESGAAPCTPDASRTVPTSSLEITPSSTTGGTGGTAGTPAARFTLGTVATNLWSAVPTNAGTGMVESVNEDIFPPTALKPNTAGCSYSLTLNWVLVGQ